MPSNLSAFLSALQSRGLAAVITDAKEAVENVGSFSREMTTILKVQSVEQVATILAEANTHKVSLTPYSAGKNWGYGSRLPVQSGSVLLDLSALNKIVAIDEEHGLAHIEPGVTQAQLSSELRKRNSRYYLDVTGSGADTSVLGNSLERGIAYQGIRVTQITHLDILLGNGTRLRTGFGDFPVPTLKGLYSYGLGPSLDGLFFQSNFGIVLQGTIKLNARPEQAYALSLSVNNDKLQDLVNALTELRRNGCIQGIPHIANRMRTVSTLIPLLIEKNPAMSPIEAEKVLSSALGGDWSLTVSVGGTSAVAKAKLNEVRRKLRPLGRVFVQSLESQSIKSKLQNLLISVLASKEQKMVLEAADKLRGLHLGEASNAGVQFLLKNQDVDKSPQGFLLCTPLAPLKGESAQIYLDVLNEHAQKFPGVQLAMTLNMITEHILEAVISVHFDRLSGEAVAAAHDCVKSLTETFNARGFYPYRVNIDQIEGFTSLPLPQWDILKKLKATLDPNGVIAPGRYS